MIELVVDMRSSNTGSSKKTVRFFNEVTLDLKYDSVASTFLVKVFFNPDNQEHAEFACVSHLHEVVIYYVHKNGSREKLITGIMLSQGFRDSAKSEEMIQIGGYSKSGAIEDCDIPSSISLESNGLSFTDIVQKIIKPFNFTFKVSGSAQSIASKVITKSTANEGRNIKSYLTEIATQRNLVLTHDPDGNLLITTPNTDGQPILDIDADVNPLVGYESMDMVFNGQPLHSVIEICRQADINGGNAAEFSIHNPFLPVSSVYRPKVVNLTSGDDVTIQDAGRNELGKSLKAISLTIVMDRGALNNKFIFPNNTITVKSRKLYLYRKTKWFIESVNFTTDNNKERTVLNCVPEYVYNKQTPVNFYVDPHQNLPRA